MKRELVRILVTVRILLVRILLVGETGGGDPTFSPRIRTMRAHALPPTLPLRDELPINQRALVARRVDLPRRPVVGKPVRAVGLRPAPQRLLRVPCVRDRNRHVRAPRYVSRGVVRIREKLDWCIE